MRPLLFDHILSSPGTGAIFETHGFDCAWFRHGNVDLARPGVADIAVEVLRRVPLLLHQLLRVFVKVRLRLLLREDIILVFLLLYDSTSRLRHEQAKREVIVVAEVRLLDLLKLVEMNRVVPALLSLRHFTQLFVVQDS